MNNINLKALVGIIGVNEHTLRAWERRYGAIQPSRSPSGRRIYSSEDVDRLKLLVALVNKNYSIGNIAGMSNAKLQELLHENENARSEASLVAQEQNTVLEIKQSILHSLKNLQLSFVQRNLQSASFKISKKTFLEKLLMPLMLEVGEMVLQKKLSVAQEHILSSMLRDQLGQIFQSLYPYEGTSSSHSKSYLLTTREGDLHEFGILSAAITCAQERRLTYYLGPSMPAHDLVSASHDIKPAFIVLGLQKLPQDTEIISTKSYLQLLEDKLPSKIAFILGGQDIEQAKSIQFNRKVYFMNSLDEFANLVKIEG